MCQWTQDEHRGMRFAVRVRGGGLCIGRVGTRFISVLILIVIVVVMRRLMRVRMLMRVRVLGLGDLPGFGTAVGGFVEMHMLAAEAQGHGDRTGHGGQHEVQGEEDEREFAHAPL